MNLNSIKSACVHTKGYTEGDRKRLCVCTPLLCLHLPYSVFAVICFQEEEDFEEAVEAAEAAAVVAAVEVGGEAVVSQTH